MQFFPDFQKIILPILCLLYTLNERYTVFDKHKHKKNLPEKLQKFGNEWIDIGYNIRSLQSNGQNDVSLKRLHYKE